MQYRVQWDLIEICTWDHKPSFSIYFDTYHPVHEFLPSVSFSHQIYGLKMLLEDCLLILTQWYCWTNRYLYFLCIPKFLVILPSWRVLMDFDEFVVLHLNMLRKWCLCSFPRPLIIKRWITADLAITQNLSKSGVPLPVHPQRMVPYVKAIIRSASKHDMVGSYQEPPWEKCLPSFKKLFRRA